mgnify:CR=1 FL=1
MNEMTFDEWCDQIDRLARKVWPEQQSYTHDTGRDCWLDAFKCGASPEEAWSEECLAAQEM